MEIYGNSRKFLWLKKKKKMNRIQKLKYQIITFYSVSFDISSHSIPLKGRKKIEEIPGTYFIFSRG